MSSTSSSCTRRKALPGYLASAAALAPSSVRPHTQRLMSSEGMPGLPDALSSSPVGVCVLGVYQVSKQGAVGCGFMSSEGMPGLPDALSSSPVGVCVLGVC